MEEVLGKLRSWLDEQLVPSEEIDLMFERLRSFFSEDWRNREGSLPTVGVYSSRRYRNTGRTHISLVITWPDYSSDTLITSGDAIVNGIGKAFTEQISRLRLEHLRAHLSYLSWPPLEGKTIEEWLESRKKNEKGVQTSDCYFIAGSWTQKELVQI